jgi:hypothetical protein
VQIVLTAKPSLTSVSMNAQISGRGVELPEENRRPAQDLVRLAQPLVLRRQPGQLGLHLARHTLAAAGVDVVLVHPAAQRVLTDPELRPDDSGSRCHRAVGRQVVPHHAHGPGLDLQVVLLGHVAILHRKEAAENPGRFRPLLR